MMNFYKNLVTVVIAVFSIGQLMAQCPAQTDEATLHFDFDACASNTVQMTNQDFSEFTAVNNNPTSCANPEVIGGSLYRMSPETFVHSCTPGVDDTPGMCVSAIRDCVLSPNTNYEVKIDLQVTPEAGSFITLSSLNFYEMAPVSFDWIGGASGGNDFPTVYSVRVFANNLEIFQSTENPTTQEWTLESFDFSNNPAFMVSTPTVFSFELVAYCPTGNGQALSVWDLDELSITTSCSFQSSVSGGNLAGGPFEFCVGDGEDDFIINAELSLSANSGSNSLYLVTGMGGLITAVTTDISTVNFDELDPGSCMIWHVAHENNFQGANVGANVNQLMGCFALSNAVMVNKQTCTTPCNVSGGIIGGGSMVICIDDGISDIFNDSDIALIGNFGENQQWIITNLSGIITALPSSISDIDFEGSAVGECLISNVSFADDFEGIAIGDHAGKLMGCHSMSNSISIIKESCAVTCNVDSGTLIGGPFEFCATDGNSDVIGPGQLMITNNSGAFSQWVLTDAIGNITALPNSFTELQFEGSGPGQCLIWHLSYQEGLAGLQVGANANQLNGCFELSNAVTVTKNDCDLPCSAEGGNLAGGPLEFCIGDGNIDFVKDGQIVQWAASGQNSQWLFTDANGNILELPNHYTELDFDGYGEGSCFIYYMTYDNGLQGLTPGTNINDLVGCYDISNSFEIIKTDCTIPCQPVGGQLLGGPFTFCEDDDVSDVITSNQLFLENAEGPINQWLILSTDGTIQALPADITNFDFMTLGLGSFQIVNMSHDPGIVGLTVGGNVPNDIDGCWGISNAITVNNITCINTGGGETQCNVAASTLSAASSISFCTDDGVADQLTAAQIVSTGGSGTNVIWLLTDTQGNVQQSAADFTTINLEGSEVGSFLIWQLYYESDITGLVAGANASDLGGCFALSNSIAIETTSCAVVSGECSKVIVNTLMGILDNNLVVLDQEVGTVKEVIPLTGGFSDDYSGFTYHEGLDQYFAVTDRLGDQTLVTIDVETGEVSMVGLITQTSGVIDEITQAEGMEYNYDNGQLYIALGENPADQNFFSRHLFTLDPTTAVATYVTEVGGSCQDDVDGLVFSQGQMYYTDGCPTPVSFGTIDLQTGEQVVLDNISELGTSSRVAADPNTGTIYMFEAIEFNLYTVDLNGDVTLVGQSYADGVFDQLMDELAFGPRLTESTFGGIILGGQFSFCISDDEPDFFEEDELRLVSELGASSQWVITDGSSNILMLPDNYTDVDFGGIQEDMCFVWHVSYDSISGLSVGENLQSAEGCYDLSNPIIVQKVTDGPECSSLLIGSEAEVNFSIVPNPIEEKLNLVDVSMSDEAGVINIIDMNGKILVQQSVIGKSFSINTDHLPNGIYFITLQSGKEIKTKRFMKM